MKTTNLINQVSKSAGQTLTPGNSIEIIAEYFALPLLMNAQFGLTQPAARTVKRLTEFISTNAKDAPVADFLNALFRDAARQGASDVHFDDCADECVIRLRLRGELHEYARVPLETSMEIDKKIRSKCSFSLVEKQAPMDGKFTMDVDGSEVEHRVSILPLDRGQSIVCRLLDSNANLTPLSEMEMPDDIRAALLRMVAQPQGLILVTGPTGSGKTTTLYGILLHLVTPQVKIITIEDPVEYRIPGLTQAQVNQQLTFAKGLKAILRQDPDAALVGEIRDKETANIAAQASLTGHIVLSMLHTNSAVITLPRMLDLEVDPNVLAASMGGFMAQRLVRRLCSHCRVPVPITHEVASIITKKGVPHEAVNAITHTYTHNHHGCEHCKAGWSGRTAIFELILPSPEVRLAIEEADTKGFASAARMQPQYRTLEHDAMLKVIDGVTSLGEALAVTGSTLI